MMNTNIGRNISKYLGKRVGKRDGQHAVGHIAGESIGTDAAPRSFAAKALAGAALVAGLGFAATAAQAHVNWSIGINVPPVGAYYGAPAYYAPAPVYVQPPAYYAPPPVYYQPRPIYYEPAPVYVRPAPRYVPAPVYSPRGYWDHGVFYRR